MAEATGGNTFTGVEWRFNHFGPYSNALAADLDWLSTQPSVEKEDISGKDKDYFLYSLGEWAKAQTFEALGLPIDVRLNLIEAIKRYAGDLSGLLDFVYFKTAPMQGATPGAVLSFAGFCKLNFKTDIKTIKIPVTVARFGGDEFVVMLGELGVDKAKSATQAGIVAEKVRTTLAEPYLLKIQQEGKAETTVEHHCAASIGVVLFINHEASAEDIIKWADMAMYQAKEGGRNSVHFFEREPCNLQLF